MKRFDDNEHRAVSGPDVSEKSESGMEDVEALYGYIKNCKEE